MIITLVALIMEEYMDTGNTSSSVSGSTS